MNERARIVAAAARLADLWSRELCGDFIREVSAGRVTEAELRGYEVLFNFEGAR